VIPEFLLRAWLAGIGLALVAGPLGCFVVWRRMAYFGDALAHSALLGVALGFLFGIDLILGVVFCCVAMALLVVLMQEQRRLATDTLLGLLAHSGLALGLVAIAMVPTVRVDLMGYLFGDVLAVGWRDLASIWGGGALVLAVLAWIWRPLLFSTVHDELAQAEGVRVVRLRLVLMLVMAVTVAMAMKIVGIMLITAMLIIPAASARRLTRSPETMAAAGSLIGVVAVSLGLAMSFAGDTPTGPSIVVAALFLFVLIQLSGFLGGLRRQGD